jgi:hypothetical protein
LGSCIRQLASLAEHRDNEERRHRKENESRVRVEHASRLAAEALGQPDPHHDKDRHKRQPLYPPLRGAEDAEDGPLLGDDRIDEVEDSVDPIAVVHHGVH